MVKMISLYLVYDNSSILRNGELRQRKPMTSRTPLDFQPNSSPSLGEPPFQGVGNQMGILPSQFLMP